MAVSVPILHRLAFREFGDAYQRYARQSLRVARRFHDAVERAVDEIAADSSRWPIFHKNYHWVKTRKFPYVLYYRMLDPYHVLIMAVAHGRRRLAYWLRRS